jgi:DNA mismatch repair ATPase MutS
LKFIELSCQRSGVIFTTMELKELNLDYCKLSDEYNKKSSGLVREVIDIVGKNL